MSRCRLFQVGKNPLALDVGRFKKFVLFPGFDKYDDCQ
ncbi:hypothetical protein NSP_15370 [Nodularia spumigena CCY9414]|nr:hypothetical protein NSP_15370 [Nodularia spumigena CCY9414]